MDEEKPLHGKTFEISMMDFRNNIGAIVTKVQLGATYVLFHGKNRKPVAVLQDLPGGLVLNIDSKGKTTYKA